ncbi:hypothetical protein GBF38_012056, partial [Nibea albiflora]
MFSTRKYICRLVTVVVERCGVDEEVSARGAKSALSFLCILIC